jgi:hypothetical protein
MACDGGWQRIAEDFRICPGDQQELDLVRFWGFYYPQNAGAGELDAFTVLIRGDGEEDLPGPVIASFGPMSATSKEATGAVMQDVDEYEYTIDLEPNVLLEGGRYWIEIHNWTGEVEGDWAWETGHLDECAGHFGLAMLVIVEPEENWIPLEPASDLALDLVCLPVYGACCVPGSGSCSIETAAGCAGAFFPNAACDEPDTDLDGLRDECDACPLDNPDDPDFDGVCESDDNCPGLYNPAQKDCDDDGVGDACCGEPDCNGNGVPDSCDIDPSDPDGNGEVSPDENGDLIPDECQVEAIPAVTSWGLVILALLLLIGAKIGFGKRSYAGR